MAVTVIAEGDQTATLGIEHSLTNTTTPGVYVFQVDASPLVTVEVLTLRVKTKTRSTGTGSTARTLYEASFTGAAIAASPNLQSPPVPVSTYVEVTLTQTGGTGRTFPWQLLSL